MTSKRQHLMDLRRHDWWYMMSDDNSVYRRGSAAEYALKNAENNNPELRGMYKAYADWYRGGKRDVDPEPTFGIAME